MNETTPEKKSNTGRTVLIVLGVVAALCICAAIVGYISLNYLGKKVGQAIQTNPDNYDAHYALGNIHFQRKEYAEAEREFRRCMNLKPDNGEAMNFYGRTLIELQRLPEAVDVLRKTAALPLYATPDKAYSSLGYALFLMGDNAGALRAYQEALKIDPPSVPRALLYLELGRLYIVQGENAKAREALAQVKVLDPQGTAGAEATKLMQKLT